MKDKLVLAYSGGLDTSYCITYLTKVKNYQVHAVHVNTGGFNELELAKLEERAYQLGAFSFQSIDVQHEYYKKCIRYLIYGNVLRNNSYPISVSSERIFQALAIVNYAKNIQADYLAHGSTGAGNDQVRFDLIFQSLAPELEIITPIRDLKLKREEEVQFLKKYGYKWSEEKKSYSINKGLWGTTIGGKETLTSNLALPEKEYMSQLTSKEPNKLKITFQKGEPVALNDIGFQNSVHLIEKLNQFASNYAIGRDIHVGDTIIGIKGRVAFEAPAALILIKAHHLLEKHVLTKWQSYWKNQLSEWYGMMLHEGQYLAPEMRNIESFLVDTQKHVSGNVFLVLKPYQFELQGIESENDLMQAKYGVYGEMNNTWNASEVKGFIKIMANPHKIYHDVHNKVQAL